MTMRRPSRWLRMRAFVHDVVLRHYAKTVRYSDDNERMTAVCTCGGVLVASKPHDINDSSMWMSVPWSQLIMCNCPGLRWRWMSTYWRWTSSDQRLIAERLPEARVVRS